MGIGIVADIIALIAPAKNIDVSQQHALRGISDLKQPFGLA